MNVMYYGMQGMMNGYQGYYPPSALTTATPTGAGLLGSGAAATGSAATALAPAATQLANTGAAASLMPKWIMPNFSATQIQYMFRHRMDKGVRVNKAVKCDTCNITLNSEQQAQQHYSGKNHLKKLRGIGPTPTGADTSPPHIPSDPNKLDPVSQAVYDNVLGKLPLKRKKEIPCTPCGLIFNSDAQATAHFTGARHKRQKLDGEGTEESASDTNPGTEPATEPATKPSSGPELHVSSGILAGDGEFGCKICKLEFPSKDQYESHASGQKHKKKELLEQRLKEGLPEGVDAKSWGVAYSCHICNVTLNSPEQLDQHKIGKQHRLKAEKATKYKGRVTTDNVSSAWTEIDGREPGWLYCHTCNVSVRTGLCLQKHVKGLKHLTNVEAKIKNPK